MVAPLEAIGGIRLVARIVGSKNMVGTPLVFLLEPFYGDKQR